jgi:hypothetical protein
MLLHTSTKKSDESGLELEASAISQLTHLLLAPTWALDVSVMGKNQRNYADLGDEDKSWGKQGATLGTPYFIIILGL